MSKASEFLKSWIRILPEVRAARFTERVEYAEQDVAEAEARLANARKALKRACEEAEAGVAKDWTDEEIATAKRGAMSIAESRARMPS
jgi:hypothetical protein